MLTRRTNIEIDVNKLEQVKKILGSSTIKDTVDSAFQELIRIKQQQDILAHRGMRGWDGCINELRDR